MSDWISVDKDLPYLYEEVLIWPLINSYGTRFTAEYQSNLCWRYFLHTDHICDYQQVNHEITHWMPLPKPPIGY